MKIIICIVVFILLLEIPVIKRFIKKQLDKSYTIMDIMYTTVLLGVGIAIGMYVSSQIEKSINKND